VLREKWTPVYAVERIDVCNGGVHEVPTIIPEIERWVMGLIENIHSRITKKLRAELTLTRHLMLRGSYHYTMALQTASVV
jgi:hypothetical protein